MSTASRTIREPKYYKVKRYLLEIIAESEPGRAVPTERDLASDIGTSRTTVRQAMIELVAEGRLERRQGSGTYVAEPKMSWPLHLTSFTEQASANGYTAHSELLGTARISADDEVARRLNLNLGAPVHRIERLRFADERPIAVEISHLPAVRFPKLARLIRGEQSLYKVLSQEFGVVPVSAEESLSTAPASPREAVLLNTDTGAPMLVLTRQSLDSDGTPVEWVTSWYRGDRIMFVAKLMLPRQ